MNELHELEAGHSIECIIHAGHSIAFNMFLYFVTCDLDLWPFNPKIISLVECLKIVSYTVPTLNALRSFIFKLSRRQTDKQTQTRMNALLPRLSSA